MSIFFKDVENPTGDDYDALDDFFMQTQGEWKENEIGVKRVPVKKTSKQADTGRLHE